MTIEDQIRDEKLQYDNSREVAKISALSSGTIDKYEYLTGDEILPSNQQQIIEQVKGHTAPGNFISFKGPLHIFKSIYSGDLALEDVEEDQRKLITKLVEIKMGNPRNTSKEEDNMTNNVINLYETRQKVFQMFNDYPREKSRRIYESKQG